MKLSETIRSRRGALGLTQEQLADTLGVTAAAVSKWENDLSLPDMALLPALARRLETDPNTLLGFSAEPACSEIAEFLNLLCDTGRQKGFDAALALARRKLQEYPASGLLLVNAATALDGLCATDPALRSRMLPEIMPLYEKAAASPDETVADARQGADASRPVLQPGPLGGSRAGHRKLAGADRLGAGAGAGHAGGSGPGRAAPRGRRRHRRRRAADAGAAGLPGLDRHPPGAGGRAETAGRAPRRGAAAAAVGRGKAAWPS